MSRVRGWLTIPLDNERMQGMAESDEDEHVDDFLHGRRLRIGIISPYAFETPGGCAIPYQGFRERTDLPGT